MKILILTKKVPYPLDDGESIAVYNMVSALHQQDVEIHLISFNTAKHYQDENVVAGGLHFINKIELVYLDNRIKPIPALMNLFTDRSYHIERFVSEKFRDTLAHMLSDETYDIIQMESIFLAPYIDTIRSLSKSKLVLRTHNIEHLIWDRISKNTANPIKSSYLNVQVDRLKSYETEVLKRFDHILAMSESDKAKMKAALPLLSIDVMPLFIDTNKYQPNKHSINACCFIGSLDWMPNEEGLLWFINKVWTKVTEKAKGIKFHIAGKNASDRLNNSLKSGIVMHGFVDSAIDFINQYSMMIVPLQSGSGIKVKILEGMALERAIVTTKVGIEGIGKSDADYVIVEDDPQSMADRIVELYQNQSQQEVMGSKAQKHCYQNFNSNRNIDNLLNIYQSLMP